MATAIQSAPSIQLPPSIHHTTPVQRHKGTTIEQILLSVNDASNLLVLIAFTAQLLYFAARKNLHTDSEESQSLLRRNAWTGITFGLAAALCPMVAASISIPDPSNVNPLLDPNNINAGAMDLVQRVGQQFMNTWNSLCNGDQKTLQAAFSSGGHLFNQFGNANSIYSDADKTRIETHRGDMQQNLQKAQESLSHMWRQEEQLGTAANSLIQRNSQH